MENSLKYAVCPYDCPSSCGFYVKVEDGRVTEIVPDKDHPVAQGTLCGKMRHYERSINSPERILTPLRRVGKKGSGEFEPISWDEALDEIAGRWKKIIAENGSESIAECHYSGVMSEIQRNCGDAFFAKLNARKTVLTLCSAAKGAAYTSVVGATGCLDPRELEYSDFYLVWGSNMPATRLPSMKNIAAAKRNGKGVALVEVCSAAMERYADLTALVRPGTDGALALAIMHCLDRDGKCDEEFMRENTEGWAELKAELPKYTPAFAESVTGVKCDKIEELARLYGSAKAPAVILGSGPSRYTNGGMTVRLILALSLCTGAWKVKGGGYCGSTPKGAKYIDSDGIRRPDFRTKPAVKVNINQFGAALAENAEPPIMSLYVYGSNPANSVSDQSAVLRGLSREDIFTVVHERFMTDTARYADIILPAAFSVETGDIYQAYGYCTLAAARRAVEPAGQCKSNWETFRLLAEKMGFEDEYFKRSEDEMIDYVLQNHTPAVKLLNREQIETLHRGGVVDVDFFDHCAWSETENKKARLFTPNQPLPPLTYAAPTCDEYPIALVSVPSADTLNSVFADRGDLNSRRGEMRLAVNTRDAEKRGVADGDTVICFNDLAEVEYVAAVTDSVSEGAAAAVGVYSVGQSLNGLTCNALHHARISDMGEGTTMNDNRVDFRRA